jgi:YidC/Oxa1 family membrane protein insertase
MDKRSIYGLVAITLIVTAWLFYMSITEQKNVVDQTPKKIEKQQDTAVTEKKEIKATDTTNLAIKAEKANIDKFGAFAPFATGGERLITIETDLYKAIITNKGAAIIRWYLNDFKTWDKKPVQLIYDKKGELYLNFLTFDAKKIDSRNLFFNIETDKDNIKLSGDRSFALISSLDLGNGRKIIKKILFKGNAYDIETEVILENLEEILPGRGYNLVWSEGLRYQEANSVDESSDALAMASMNGEVEEVDASGDDPVEASPTGIVDFAATKTKYFTAAIIPQPYRSFDGTVDLAGKKFNFYKGNELKNSTVEKYTISFRTPYKGGTQSNKFKVYIGPLDYDIVKNYGVGLENTINFGWRLVVRPIGEFFMLPIFSFINKFANNYGIAIIIFSILIKFLLYPLSIQQLKSSQKMQVLAPEINRLREKYKDDQTKQQQETMKLYSEYGINPMGGCLPLILQMPILYALWAVLRGSIDLRQSEFIFWMTDLSIPDVIFDLGFKLPLIGIDKFSGLALLMGATLFIQQKMTVTDPRQQALVWMMPIMFTLMFSNFPAGLNLYYFMFNLFGIIQQVYMNKFSKNKMTLEQMKRMPKKEGWLQKKMREAQDIAASQGRTIPGQKSDSKPQNQRRKKK